MTILYIIAIDQADDGSFSELGDAISADVLAARWRLGMTQPYQAMAQPARAEITVRNRDGSYSPERSGELISKTLRIMSDDGSTVRTHFTGFIESIEPEAGTQGSQQARIIARGYGAQLEHNPAKLPAQVNRRADQAINALLQRGIFRYPVLDGYCVLDRAGQNVINATKIFPAQAIDSTLEAGKSTFTYLGDDWDDALSLAQAVEILSRSEGGRFFFNREGCAVFHNRHHSLIDASNAATFSDDLADLRYSYGEDRVTQVQVRSRARSIGAAHTLLWSLDQPLLLDRNATVQLTIPYTVDGEPTAALEVETELIFQAQMQSVFGNVDASPYLVVRLIEVGFREATLEIRSRINRPVTLQTMELYGTPLHIGNTFTVTESDAMNFTFYGLRSLALDVPAVSSVEEASAVARYEMLRRGAPRGTIRTMSISTRTHPQETLSLTLADKISISESQTGHSGSYVIIGEEHTVDSGGSWHRVTYLLEADDGERFFVVDRHNIDGSRVLIPR